MDEPKGKGRPSKYSQKLADEICFRIAKGSSVKKLCEQEDMPDFSTVWAWLREKEDFSHQYARACQDRAESQNEMLLELGDDAISLSQEVDPKASGAVVQAVKLKADNLKWVMSKMKPKKYGDQLDVTSGGEPIKVNVITYGGGDKPAV